MINKISGPSSFLRCNPSRGIIYRLRERIYIHLAVIKIELPHRLALFICGRTRCVVLVRARGARAFRRAAATKQISPLLDPEGGGEGGGEIRVFRERIRPYVSDKGF